MNMMRAESGMAMLNFNPILRRMGRTRKNINEGRTAQKMLMERSMIF
jgi:hypothetical protein